MAIDALIARMTRLSRPIAHAHTEWCMGSTADDIHGHSPECESLTEEISVKLAEMYLEAHRCGAEVGCRFHFHDRFHDYNRYY